jgi:hypothetical protein
VVISYVGELIESDGEELTDELIQLEEALFAETEADALEEPHKTLEHFPLNEVLLALHDIAAGMTDFKKVVSNVAHFLKVQTAIEDAVGASHCSWERPSHAPPHWQCASHHL